MEEKAAEQNSDRQTRSGKKPSAATKRKRSNSIGSERSGAAKKKMGTDEEKPISVQLAELKNYLAKKIEDGVSQSNVNISALGKRMDKNEVELEKHKKHTQDSIDALAASVDAVSARLGAGPGNAAAASASYATMAGRVLSAAQPANSVTQSQQAQYWVSRQSARISPVAGDGEKEMWDNMQIFFFEKMRIPRTDLSERDISSVRRVLTARGRKSKLELLVKFVDVETRDRVATYARNLGEYIDKGKATVTFRHDIPSHLAGVHRTLLQYGHGMAQKHGRGFRRNIRFDDTALSFCIDICIPGGDNKWITVTYQRAFEDRKLAQIQDDRRRGSELSTQRDARLDSDEMDQNESNVYAANNGDHTNSSSQPESAATGPSSSGLNSGTGAPGFSFVGRGSSRGPTWGSNK